MPPALPKACIIGAGCSGFTTARRLKDAGVPYDCFEMSDEIGGNWYYKNPNGMSACYRACHRHLEVGLACGNSGSGDGPTSPHPRPLFQYFKDTSDHFGLRETITSTPR